MRFASPGPRQSPARSSLALFLGSALLMLCGTGYLLASVLNASNRPSWLISPFSSTPLSGQGHEKVFLLMPLNERGLNTLSCRAIGVGIINGYEPIIYNWEAEGGKEAQQLQKVKGLLDAMNSNLAGASEGDLVFMMDAFDVWLQLSPAYLVSRFREFDAEMAIGADRDCWPNEYNSSECVNAPPSTLPPGLYHNFGEEPERSDWRIGEEDASINSFGPPRHANSGTVVGRLGFMRRFFKQCVEEIESGEHDFPNDQGIFNIHLHDPSVKLDYASRLFWTGNYDASSAVYINTPRPIDPAIRESIIPWHLFPPIMHHKLTGEVPVAVHFNDPTSKGRLDSMWGEPWYSHRAERFKEVVEPRLARGKVQIARKDGGFVVRDFAELCPAYYG